MKNKIIYLDSAASTPVSKEVLKAMEPYFFEEYGNPSSPHMMGEHARGAIDSARKNLAQELGCKAQEILFTSGATESNNLAISGLAVAYGEKKKIIISAIEHASVYETCKALRAWGYDIVEIPVNINGMVDLEVLNKSLDDNTLLVSVIHGNNEIGVLQNLRKIADLCKKKGVFFHTDAAQSFCKEKISVNALGIDVLSASAHKIGGPKGIGLLYVREGIKIMPILCGGGQERGIRAGTENVPAIMGFAKAVELSRKVNYKNVEKIREYFVEQLEKIGGKINGSLDTFLAGIINVSLPGIDGSDAVVSLSAKGIMCSTGSACDSRKNIDKRVLKAIGLSDKKITGALRFALHEKITKKDIDYVISELKKIVKV